MPHARGAKAASFRGKLPLAAGQCCLLSIAVYGEKTIAASIITPLKL
jgi:hypothetical protein